MKTFNIFPVLLAVFILVLVRSGMASDGQYEQAMKKNIEAVYKAQTIEAYQQAINAFERIGMAEKNRWEPHYYAAFAYLMMSFRETDGAKKDLLLDKSLEAVKKAKDVSGDASELYAMEGFVHMIRVSVDPASRGPQYAGLSMQSLGKAVELNPENPRAYALLAQMQYGTAQFFGSSTKEACDNVTKALEKFDTFKSDNPLAPTWGRPMAESMRAQCK